MKQIYNDEIKEMVQELIELKKDYTNYERDCKLIEVIEHIYSKHISHIEIGRTLGIFERDSVRRLLEKCKELK